MKLKALHIVSLMALVLLSTFWGCDNSIDPFEDITVRYSIYGALNINKEINYIRIRDLSFTIDEAPETIDITVTLKSLATGEIESLQDSLVVFDGVNTHNFVSRMNIEPETTYRLTITKPDGDSFSVSATTPKLIENISTTITERLPDGCYTELKTRFYPYNINYPVVAQVGYELINNTDEIVWYDLGRPQISEQNQEFTIDVQIRNLLWITVLGRSPDVPPNYCVVLRSATLYFSYRHFGPEYVTNAASDSLNASGNMGNFIAFYTDTIAVEVPQLEDVISN